MHHRLVRLLKQQSSITVYSMSTKENEIPFSLSHKQMEIFSFCFPFAANREIETWRNRHGDMDMETQNFKWKTEAQAIFLYLFTFCSSRKRKFAVCPFVDEEINGSYLFANGLKGLNGLNRFAQLCMICLTFPLGIERFNLFPLFSLCFTAKKGKAFRYISTRKSNRTTPE